MNFILAGFKIKTEGHSWVRSRLWCVSLKDWKQTSLSDDALSHFSGFHQTFFFVSLDSPNESMENVFKTNLKGFLWTANNRSGYEMFILFRAFLTFSKSFYVILVCYFAVLLASYFLLSSWRLRLETGNSKLMEMRFTLFFTLGWLQWWAMCSDVKWNVCRHDQPLITIHVRHHHTTWR